MAITTTASGKQPASESTSASAANPNSHSQPPSLPNQIAFLQDLVSSPTSEEDATVNLATLLQQLDAADDVAKGVEGKLDNLLDNLEGMLKGLEGTVGAPKDGKGEDGGGGGEAESATSPNLEAQETNKKSSE